MIDLATEEIISLAEACSLVPGSSPGKRLHISTIYRWTETGARGVKLQTVQVGGKRCTTRAFINQFIEELSKPEKVQATKERIVMRCHSGRRGRKRNAKSKVN